MTTLYPQLNLSDHDSHSIRARNLKSFRPHVFSFCELCFLTVINPQLSWLSTRHHIIPISTQYESCLAEPCLRSSHSLSYFPLLVRICTEKAARRHGEYIVGTGSKTSIGQCLSLTASLRSFSFSFLDKPDRFSVFFSFYFLFPPGLGLPSLPSLPLLSPSASCFQSTRCD